MEEWEFKGAICLIMGKRWWQPPVSPFVIWGSCFPTVSSFLENKGCGDFLTFAVFHNLRALLKFNICLCESFEESFTFSIQFLYS